MAFICNWFDVCEYLKPTNLREYKLGALDCFKKENCQRSSIIQYFRENVGCCKIDLGQYESTIKIDATVFDGINLLECDKKDFIFDAERRLWVVDPKLEVKDTITQILKNNDLAEQQWIADADIVKKLSSEQNVEKLLSIIEQIPNLDIKLSAL